jgi:hypothetical protein
VPNDELTTLRAELDAIDDEMERTQKDEREARAELQRRIEAWDAHLLGLRGERVKKVQAIKAASQRARGLAPRE